MDHELMLRAVRKHVTCKWALLYIERWLKAPMVKEEGTTMERNCGTPQGGVVTQFWPISFFTTRSTSGGRGHILISHGVGMLTMDWCTAVASKKQKPSRRSSKRVWRNAVWRCTRRKPKSSTAKTRSAEASTRMSSLISSGTAFGLDWYDVSGTTRCSADSIRQ